MQSYLCRSLTLPLHKFLFPYEAMMKRIALTFLSTFLLFPPFLMILMLYRTWWFSLKKSKSQLCSPRDHSFRRTFVAVCVTFVSCGSVTWEKVRFERLKWCVVRGSRHRERCAFDHRGQRGAFLAFVRTFRGRWEISSTFIFFNCTCQSHIEGAWNRGIREGKKH